MVLTELRKAVIDTVEFIIPPFIKLFIAVAVGNYVTYGKLVRFSTELISLRFKSIQVSTLKGVIDSLYLSSIVPIIAVLFIILLAYAINRITDSVGSLVPIVYTSVSAIRNTYYINRLWMHFPQIKNLNELRIKVKQLLSLAKASDVSFPFEQIKWQEEKKQKKFRTITFMNFLLIWSIAGYIFFRKYMKSPLNPNQLFITISIILLLVVIKYFQIARNELDIESTELMIVDNFMRTKIEYKKTEDPKEIEQIKRLINVEAYYYKRWWSLSIGYRMDWLKMYKYYRPPYYWSYIKWKEMKENK